MVKIYAKYEHFLFQLDKFIRTLKRSNIEKPNFFFLSFVILIFFFPYTGYNFIAHFGFRISVGIAKDITAMSALQKNPAMSLERAAGTA